jgi:hypothetical protein
MLTPARLILDMTIDWALDADWEAPWALIRVNRRSERLRLSTPE